MPDFLPRYKTSGSAYEVLFRARSMVAQEYIKNAFAKNSKGKTENVMPSTTDIVAVCTAGGLHRSCCGNQFMVELATKFLMQAAGIEFRGLSQKDRESYRDIGVEDIKTIGRWHDSHSLEHILATFDKAMELARPNPAPDPKPTAIESLQQKLGQVTTADEARAVALSALELADAFTENDLKELVEVSP